MRLVNATKAKTQPTSVAIVFVQEGENTMCIKAVFGYSSAVPDDVNETSSIFQLEESLAVVYQPTY